MAEHVFHHRYDTFEMVIIQMHLEISDKAKQELVPC